MSIDTTEPFTGIVRAAMANNCTSGRSAFHCNRRPPADPTEPVFGEILDAHAHGEWLPAAQLSRAARARD
jgi:hypothetical protein